MYFDIKNCTIKEVLDVVSGTSKSGNDWTKATVIIEHKDGDYTDTYPMTVFGSDKVQEEKAAAAPAPQPAPAPEQEDDPDGDLPF